jgi:hypothetical protein
MGNKKFRDELKKLQEPSERLFEEFMRQSKIAIEKIAENTRKREERKSLAAICNAIAK